MAIERKHELLEKHMAGDQTDIAVNARETCLAGIPTAETKERIWKEITDVNS